MKIVYYNLQIKLFKDEYKTFNKIRTKDVVKYLESELLRIHDIEYKCNNNAIYNMVNRPNCVNRLVRHYVKLEYWKENVEINRNTSQN